MRDKLFSMVRKKSFLFLVERITCLKKKVCWFWVPGKPLWVWPAAWWRSLLAPFLPCPVAPAVDPSQGSPFLRLPHEGGPSPLSGRGSGWPRISTSGHRGRLLWDVYARAVEGEREAGWAGSRWRPPPKQSQGLRSSEEGSTGFLKDWQVVSSSWQGRVSLSLVF